MDVSFNNAGFPGDPEAMKNAFGDFAQIVSDLPVHLQPVAFEKLLEVYFKSGSDAASSPPPGGFIRRGAGDPSGPKNPAGKIWQRIRGGTQFPSSSDQIIIDQRPPDTGVKLTEVGGLPVEVLTGSREGQTTIKTLTR